MSPSLGEIFATQLSRAGGRTLWAQDLEEARRLVVEIAQAAGPGRRVRWSTPLAATLDPEALAFGPESTSQEWRQRCFDAPLGITEADWALADTGTLVLESGPAKSRLVSLLPPVHLALLPESRFLQGLGSLIARSTENSRLAGLSCLTFITGPSRTADIEQTLTIGVHGPQELHVLILRNQ